MNCRKLAQAFVLGITSHVLTAPAATASVIQLTSPAEFIFSTITIDFDGVPDLTIANALFSGQGIEFSRDDGQPVPVLDWASLPPPAVGDRTTTSSPNVIATILGSFIGGSAPSFVTHLNATFDSPMLELGAFFGNDQAFDGYTQTTLSVFDEFDSLLGSVVLSTNDNSRVDQFIGLRSDVPFFRARFDNNGISLSVVLDDIRFGGTSVPEPATFALLALGLAVLGLNRRKRAM